MQKSAGGKGKFFSRRTMSFKQEIFVLYFSITDNRTPLPAKLVAFFALAYLISPIDLIPDFIPVAGYLDDLVIVPLLLHVAFTLLPAVVKDSGLVKAKKHAVKLRIALVILVLIVLGMLTAMFFLIKTMLHQF